jgi:hypothetical protein
VLQKQAPVLRHWDHQCTSTVLFNVFQSTFLIWKETNKRRLLLPPHCLLVRVTFLDFLMPAPIFTKLGMRVMSPEYILTEYPMSLFQQSLWKFAG